MDYLDLLGSQDRHINCSNRSRHHMAHLLAHQRVRFGTLVEREKLVGHREGVRMRDRDTKATVRVLVRVPRGRQSTLRC